MRISAVLACAIGSAALITVTACQQNAPQDQGVVVEKCRQVMVKEFEDQTAWWTPGHRPAACKGVSDDEFARLADEVTGSQRNPGEWDQ